jgi:hypothetical protein
MVTMANFVPGETLRVQQILHRFKCNMIQFPGMTSWTTIYRRTGEEIEQWMRDQVQVDCVVYVLSRSWVPCCEEIDPDEEYEDTHFGVTLLEELREAPPVDHTFTRSPDFQQKRQHQAFQSLKAMRQRIETRYFRDARNPDSEEVAGFWARLRRRDSEVKEKWIEEELSQILPEQVVPTKCISELRAVIRKAVREEARMEWNDSEELQRVMTQDEFVIKMLSTVPALCGDHPIQDRINAHASLWTETRDALLTTEIQRMDTCPTLEQAERYWARICAHPWFKFVSPEILKKRAIEIRMLCMDESTLEGISIRCWKYVFNASTTGEVQCMFDRHLAHYGPVGPAVAERMSVAIVSVLREMLEKPKKIKIWRRLVLATEILGHGLSRLDEKIYEAWWDSVIEKRGQGILSTEEDGSFTWDGIPVKEEKLCTWVAEKIMTMKVSDASICPLCV